MFQAIHLHATIGEVPGALVAFATSLLLTAGAALLLLNKMPWRAKAR